MGLQSAGAHKNGSPNGHGPKPKPAAARRGRTTAGMWMAFLLAAAMLIAVFVVYGNSALDKGVTSPSFSPVITRPYFSSGIRNASSAITALASARLGAGAGAKQWWKRGGLAGGQPQLPNGVAQMSLAQRAQRQDAIHASAAYWASQHMQRWQPSGYCRHFRVGDRKDFLMTIAPMLTDQGLCPSFNKSFDVYWGFALNAIEAFMAPQLKKNVADDAIINSLPMMMQLVGEKPSIANLQHDCFKNFYKPHKGHDGKHERWAKLEQRGWCSFTQPGFNARREHDTGPVRLQYNAMHTFADRKHKKTGKFPGLWIVKSMLAYSQQGIQLVWLREEDLRDDASFARWAEQRIPKGDFTVQYYLADPMQWRDRKFDMRVLALITSVRPLRFYVLDHAFPKIATKAYTTRVESLKDSCVHFRMPVCEDPVKPYPESTDRKLFRDNLLPPLSSYSDWDTRLYPALYKTLLKVVLLARKQLLKADRRLCKHGFLHKRVQVLQPDVIYDVAGNAYVIEMNTNGFMVGSLHKEFFDATLQMRSALEISGVGRYPLEPRYREGKSRVMGEYCAGTDGLTLATDADLAGHGIPTMPQRCMERLADTCTAREGDAIATMLDEWCHAGRWLSVWPPRDERTFKHVTKIYKDVSQDVLRPLFWSPSDGQMLRFARWMQLDSEYVRDGALAFCGAENQRLVENRTLGVPGCKCRDTLRRPNQEHTAKVLSIKNPNRPDAKKPKNDTVVVAVGSGSPAVVSQEDTSGKDLLGSAAIAQGQLKARMPVRDLKRFPPGYEGEGYDGRSDNGKLTQEFENARIAGFKMYRGQLVKPKGEKGEKGDGKGGGETKRKAHGGHHRVTIRGGGGARSHGGDSS